MVKKKKKKHPCCLTSSAINRKDMKQPSDGKPFNTSVIKKKIHFKGLDFRVLRDVELCTVHYTMLI